MVRGRLLACLLLVVACAAPVAAQSSLAGDALHIARATGPIKIDGDLSDDGWRSATRVERWYEVQPGDNNEPPVHNLGLLAFDDRFLYVGFELDDRVRSAHHSATTTASTATARTLPASSSTR
jgi:hypothetical protein